VPINIVYIRNQSTLLANYNIYIRQCNAANANSRDEVYAYPNTICISPQDRGLSNNDNKINSTALVLFNLTEQRVDSHSEDAFSDFELNVKVIFSTHTLQLPQFLNTTWTQPQPDSINHRVQFSTNRDNQRPSIVSDKEEERLHIQNQRLQLVVVLFLFLYYWKEFYRTAVKSSLYLHSQWMLLISSKQ